MLNPEMVREATRLTRAGQLVEATALLQRMLRGDGAHAATRGGAVHVKPARLEPPTLDLKANVVEERESGPSTQATSVQRRKRHLPFGMKNLSGVSLPGPVGRTPPSKGDIAPDGTRFVAATFANAAGSRTYKLFIPSRADRAPRPLVVMLHGCTQSPDDFAAGTRMNFLAEEQNCFVVYPEQPRGANQAKCWNWFRTGDQQRDGGEPSLIAGITRKIMREHPIDPKRVYVAGLSAGGAAAAIMGATYPDLYAAVGVHSGLACGAASDLPTALTAMRQGSGPRGIAKACSPVPTIVFHGDRDTTVHPDNGERVLDPPGEAEGQQAKVVRGRVPEGHAYTRTILADGGGVAISEHWSVHGAGHAWSGGSPAGSYTDPRGPDATREMLRFFLEHSLASFTRR
ncbi:extracellular catalytic domain type 1 short-chain-length polyhydroxyalkanoate depolymerase [Bradyrhizobium cytisi]|uniref:PHB depolymerase family esterase n=1 Tax=Bradyrhizobium cytisi TaxID=515489 RepID=A0A5S4WX36_9BRAD|nr:PHB depolymerase family esterase [Bradyrhizobium cytisi]TYL84717.1 PHB depolymerase family esterase [Bradyrhizobium cytisi]